MFVRRGSINTWTYMQESTRGRSITCFRRACQSLSNLEKSQNEKCFQTAGWVENEMFELIAQEKMPRDGSIHYPSV